ncbi:MAG: hypothetical protein ABSH14_00125 [Verrucomicrobiia bacterium]
MAVLGARTRVCAVGLFFAVTGPLAVGGAPAATDELRVLVERLTNDNERLKTELDQRETVIRLLTENLAVARTESELFQKQWREAQLRAQALGVNFADDSARQTQRQLVESVRALYLAEVERQRLVEQLQRLLDAVQKQGDIAGELARTKALLAAAEKPAANEAGKTGGVVGQAGGTLGAATVLDVNPDLRLVVLNVGLLQGARIGMPLIVLRGDRVIAELKIVDVRQRICGALIERTEKQVTLKTGDVARVAKNS